MGKRKREIFERRNNLEKEEIRKEKWEKRDREKIEKGKINKREKVGKKSEISN